MIKFEIKNRFSGVVQFTAEVDCDENAHTHLKIGLAVKAAIASVADLRGADLSGAALSGADLSWAALSWAALSGADLRRADLSGADLRRADLSGADLSWADLRRADLRGADLSWADLSGADLRGADLSGAALSWADLSGADLRRADLSGAALSGADLSGADLRGADLRRADLSGGKNTSLTIARTRILPEGEIIGWKKCKNNIIAKLSIPSAARRSHAFGRKCRAEYVDVIELFGGDVGETSNHNQATEYRAGTRVTADSWDEDWTNECSHGIHFFITREEAEDYQ